MRTRRFQRSQAFGVSAGAISAQSRALVDDNDNDDDDEDEDDDDGGDDGADDDTSHYCSRSLYEVGRHQQCFRGNAKCLKTISGNTPENP